MYYDAVLERNKQGGWSPVPGHAAVTIRPARQHDLGGVTACLAAAFAPYRTRYTPGAFRDTVPTGEQAEARFRAMTILVAEAEGIIGTIAYQVMGAGEGHLRGMAVVPAFQGAGVAGRLLAAAEAALREAGCRRVTLDTTAPLRRAIGFYERHGYRATGSVQDFFGMPVYEYEKTLPGGAG